MHRSLRLAAVFAVALAAALALADRLTPAATAGPDEDGAKAPQPADVAKPATRFEEFSSATGAVLVMESFPLGDLPVKYGAGTVALRRMTHLESGLSKFGLRFTYDEGGRYSRERSEFVDEDEIDGLASALEYLRSNRGRATKEAKTYSEFTYRSRGGFRVGYYVEPTKQAVGDYITVGASSVFPHSLDPIATMVAAAQRKIKELRGD